MWLNFGAHVFGNPGSAAGRLIDETGVPAVPVPGRLTAVALGDRVVARGPVETYPFQLPLPLRSRLSLLRAGAKLRLAVRRYAAVAAERPGEAASDRQRRMLEFLDDRSFSDFIGPLPADVDAIFRATLNRSSGEPEELAAGYGIGYFHLVWNRSAGLSRNIVGGPGLLIDALAAGVHGRILTSARVSEVAAEATASSSATRTAVASTTCARSGPSSPRRHSSHASSCATFHPRRPRRSTPCATGRTSSAPS